MNSSDTPSRIVKAFGINGLKNTIPVDSSTTTDNNGVATFDKGFPPITMQPLSAGGIPPSGKDMNGALYAVTLQQQWQNAGMGYPFHQEYANQIGGYPKGSFIPNSLGSGYWINYNEANTTAPENNTGFNTGWVPVSNYGSTILQGISNQSVTLTSLQASKDRIIISGTLTSNINIVFPSWIKSWVVQNNCVGSFAVTCKTVLGGGSQVPNGFNSYIYCDGTNINSDLGTASQRNVGNQQSQIPDMGFFGAAMATTGYQKLPSGLIIQWGTARCGGSGSNNAGVLNTFSIPFPQECLNLTLSHIGFNPQSAGVLSYLPSGKTGFFGYSSVATQSSPVNANYTAVGL